MKFDVLESVVFFFLGWIKKKKKKLKLITMTFNTLHIYDSCMFSINVKVCEEKQEKKEKKKKGGTCRWSNRVITWLFIYSLCGPGRYLLDNRNLANQAKICYIWNMHGSSIVPQLTYSTLYVNIKRVERERIYIR